MKTWEDQRLGPGLEIHGKIMENLCFHGLKGKFIELNGWTLDCHD
jgi:hypothetical protein